MDFDGFGKKNIKLIDAQLKIILKQWRSEVGKINKDLLPLVDEFIEGCDGGKRIRGLLVILGFHLVNGKIQKDIYKIAAAYEIMHTAILAHDDVMDQSELRRGKPSLYQALGKERTGESLAICLGDAGFFLATRIISETNFPENIKIKALNFFSQIMINTGVGQILDIKHADALITTKLKTARYTISGPLVLGAILAGANQKISRNLEKFGENLGIAYQIQDDILDNEAGIWGGIKLAKETENRYNTQAAKALPGLTKDKKMSTLLEQLIYGLMQRKN